MKKELEEWGEVASRADELRDRVAMFSLAEMAPPPELLADLAQLDDEANSKLRMLYRDKSAGG